MAEFQAAPTEAATLSSATRMHTCLQGHDPEYKARYPAAWNDLPEDDVCSTTIYDLLAVFMVNVYVTVSGVGLGPSTVLGYLGMLIQSAAVKFKVNGT